MKARALALLIITGALGLFLMLLALPRLRASLAYLPVDAAISIYYASQVIPTEQLPGLIGQAEQAIRRHDHYRYHDGLSTLHYLYAIDDRSPSLARRAAFERSLAEAETAAAYAPAQPMVWQRIARIHALLRHAPGQVISALKMSIYAGRVEPTLLMGRLELGFLYLDSLDEEGAGLLRDQALLAWKLQPRELAREISAQRISMANIRALLERYDDPALQEMEASLERDIQ